MNTGDGGFTVALLCSDPDLGEHLRAALKARDAHIVHDGAASGTDSRTLGASGADVVIVNLESDEEDSLDALQETLDAGDWNVIFNDAEASRSLAEWERARWARHLAAKLAGDDNVDPPRPADAEDVVIPDAASVPDASADTGAPTVTAMRPEEPTTASAADATTEDATTADATPSSADDAGHDADDPSDGSGDFDQLGAELENLLAEGSTAPEAEGPAASLQDTAASPASDMDFLAAQPADAEPEHDAADNSRADDTEFSAAVDERQTLASPAPVSDWELIDNDAEKPAPAPREEAGEFGIEKVDDSDYLRPQHEAPGDVAGDMVAGLHLELESLTDSDAPKTVQPTGNEMNLDPGTARLRKVVVVAAGLDATAHTARVLSAIPETCALPIVIVQHQHSQALDALQATLTDAASLTVRAAEDGAVVRPAQAWLVPADKQCHLRRDGQMRLSDAATVPTPGIDGCVRSLLHEFGADLTLVMLSGSGEDAADAAQTVATAGGRVWLLAAAAADPATMAGAIAARGVVSASGTEDELAGWLSEEQT